MIRLTFIFLLGVVMSLGSLHAQDRYKPGDVAMDFELKNIDGEMVSMADFEDAKGFVVVFSCNHCPYVKMYEDRMVELDEKLQEKGFRLIAINPNDDKTYPDDSFKNMQKRAKQKGFEFPYLRDETQEVARAYGAKKTPEVFLLERVGDQLIVRYVGAIDDNYKSADDVEERYVEGAVDAILAKETVDPNQIPAVGCGVKYKKS